METLLCSFICYDVNQVDLIVHIELISYSSDDMPCKIMGIFRIGIFVSTAHQV